MDSINTILHSQKFQEESPEQLNRLISKIQRENFNAEVSAFSPVSPTGKADQQDRQLNQSVRESKNKNAA